MTTVTLIQEAVVQTNVERNRDKMKDDAIAQLSDQLLALTARMQEIEIGQFYISYLFNAVR
jgi:hypothetical protein